MVPRRWIAGVLVVLTLVVYAPVRNHEFIDYDDNCYVYKNELVQQGFTVAGLKFAFGQLHGRYTYWHPVTWVSHMLDCELFGTAAGPHHLVNVLFHLANVVLLFLWLHALTGRLWPSAAVAMLFAWHPLQVDTVAWVAERKNLLSALFWILSLWSYTTYVQRGRRRFYFGALGLFAVGLMCKPAIVTLPCVLLLLDVWPLQRVTFSAGDLAAKAGRLLGEKVPFFGLTIASCLLTIKAHAELGMLVSTGHTPLAARIANSLASYALYLKNVAFPNHLAVLYPQETVLPWGIVAAGVVVVVAPLIAGWVLRSRFPCLLIGWLWFLGTLVPTIGLVQAGHQAMADRFAYVPVIGLFLVVVWSGAELAARWQWRPRTTVTAAAAVGLACLALTARQVAYWQDTRTVFEHAVAVTQRNYIAHKTLGNEAAQRGDFAAGLLHFGAAEAIAPTDPEIAFGFALTYLGLGRLAEAEVRLAEILRRLPNHARALNGLGFLRMQQGRFEEAREYCQKAIQLDPEVEEARINLELLQNGAAKAFPALVAVKAQLVNEPGNIELRLRAAALLVTVLRPQEAGINYQQVLAQNPNEPRALTGLGVLAARAGQEEEAINLLERAVAADGKSGDARCQLGAVLEQLGRATEALAHYEAAVQAQPELEQAWSSLGLLHAKSGRMADALGALARAARLRPADAEIQMRAGLAAANLQRTELAAPYLRAAMRLRPDWPLPLNTLAWLLATHPDAAARNGAEAVKLARRACELTKFENSLCLDVLGAALAESGELVEAQTVAKKALQRVQAANPRRPVSEFAARLELYRSGRPYHQPRITPSSP